MSVGNGKKKGVDNFCAGRVELYAGQEANCC